MSYKGGKANMMARVPLGGLKPAQPTPRDDTSVQYAKLERMAMEQAEEIAALQKELLEERQKNAKLEEKLNEMLQFLEEYDLHWVGGPGPKDKTYPNGPDDMNRFMVRISELNSIAEKQKAFLKKEGNVARVDHKKPITITLYNDHFTLDGGEKRMYELPVNAQFFRDIYDGFFPSEFKQDYPEGVCFKIDDQRKPDAFQGRARQLGQSPEEIEERCMSARSDRRVESGEYGSGDGKLQIRAPPFGNKVLLTTADMKLREVRRFVASTFKIDEFEVCDPVSGKPYPDDSTLKSLQLYPRGLVSIISQRKD